MNSPAHGLQVDRDDIQGLLQSGYGKHTEACFLLLQVKDRDAACRWLAAATVTSAREVERTSASVARAKNDRRPETILQLALSSEGMRALGVPEDIVNGFSAEFVSGMSGDANRARRLGDVDASAPERWQWGAGQRIPHVLVLLYALPGRLEAWRSAVQSQCESGFTIMESLNTANALEFEPFGFKDGISQPQLDWERQRAARDEEQLAYTNLSCLGEFLLGYPNEYGGYTDRPLFEPEREAGAMLPRAEEAPDKADLGRNGSYLVLRQLRQDVRGFWQFLDEQSGGDAGLRESLGAAMVGRSLDGTPLVDDVRPPDDLNAFSFESDPEGFRCPLGAHIRRANPRNADLPAGKPGILSKLIRIFGFDARALKPDLIASARFHRLLRRGRKYGPVTAPRDALTDAHAGEESGLYFLCLAANIVRQFEFVQGSWLIGTKFGGLTAESDPLLGTRSPSLDQTKTDRYSMPQPGGPDRCIMELPRFVTVRGGAYFFMPGIRALRYLADVGRRRPQ